MNKIIIYGLIFLFLYLIIQHFILTTKEGLENSCVTPSDASDGNSDGGCKRVATQQNSQAAQFTRTRMKNAKTQIEALINKVSKLIQNQRKKLDNNTKAIETNAENVVKMKQAITPDKKK
jgi:hypothetical protein